MTDQTIPVEKLRTLLNRWEGLTRGDSHHVSATGVLKELRDLLPPVLPDPLFLAKAKHPEYGEGAVISHCLNGEGEVQFIFRADGTNDGTRGRWVSPADLTFHTPDHPVFLKAKEDYESAPEGTVVVDDDEKRIVLVDERWFSTASAASFDHSDMAGIRRRALRWGWEA